MAGENTRVENGPSRPAGTGPAPRRPLQDSPGEAAAPQPKAAGWHPVDWLCEFAGTAFQLFLGFCAVGLLESDSSPVAGGLPGWLRLVLIGLIFGLLAAVVAVSPVGRRSGAHLNPAVTFGFLLRGHTPWRDALGYAVAQMVGAVVAAAGFVAVEPAWAASVHAARTAPRAGLAASAVVGIEAALTLGLLFTVFLMVSSARTARWTPAVVAAVLSGLVWVGAPYTGASMNPARTLGPDTIIGSYPLLWAYFLGPAAGALLAVALFGVVARERRTLTAKLYHDHRYPSVHATTLPARPHPGAGNQAG